MPDFFSAISTPIFDIVVATTVDPANFPCACKSRAVSSSTPSPFTTRPAPSQNKARSASPSNVTPRSNFPPDSSTALPKVSGCSAPHPALIFFPSGATHTNSTCTPSARNNSGASAAAAPFAQSTSTRNPLKSAATLPASASMYALRRAISPGRQGRAIFSAVSSAAPGLSSRAKISFSIASSRASVSLNPSPEKTLIPLSVHGLCDAEITTPAANPRDRARYATPGVVITPALCISTPTAASPAATRSAIHPLDSRVSCPITACAARAPRIKSCPSARPIRYVLSAVSGNSPAIPRIPSVPNNCLI